MANHQTILSHGLSLVVGLGVLNHGCSVTFYQFDFCDCDRYKCQMSNDRYKCQYFWLALVSSFCFMTGISFHRLGRSPGEHIHQFCSQPSFFPSVLTTTTKRRRRRRKKAVQKFSPLSPPCHCSAVFPSACIINIPLLKARPVPVMQTEVPVTS